MKQLYQYLLNHISLGMLDALDLEYDITAGKITGWRRRQ